MVGDIFADPNYMEHHGIQGQKWGVRRFQNEDGTLTEAGRERYLKRSEENSEKIFQARYRYADHHINPDTNGEVEAFYFDKAGKKLYKNPGEKDLSQKTIDKVKSITDTFNSELDQDWAEMRRGKERNSRGFMTSKKKAALKNVADIYHYKTENTWAKWNNTLMDYVNRLPKSERDSAVALAYELAGLNW